MNKGIKKVWNVFTSILVGAIVILAIALVGVRLFGLQVFTVLSGSMEPTYKTGSIIYVKKVDPFELKENNVITYMLDEDTLSTHRIVEVVPDSEDTSVVRFRTKGDANNDVDGKLVHYKNVVGTPVFTIPYLGYLLSYIQSPPGLYVALAFGCAVVLMVFLPELFAKDDSKSQEKNK